jgi:NAD(P)H-dependent FMN reductase
MEASLRIGVILASIREGRHGEAFAQWILSFAAQRPNVQVEMLDLRDWPLPFYPYRETPVAAAKAFETGGLARRWADKIASLDAFIVVTPEYNHGYPGALKNAFDHVYDAWNRKAVGFVGYGGFAAGARAVEQLRLVAVELRMVPVRDEVDLRLVGFVGDERGWPKEEIYAKRAAALLDDLLWWARLAKEGRGRPQ